MQRFLPHGELGTIGQARTVRKCSGRGQDKHKSTEERMFHAALLSILQFLVEGWIEFFKPGDSVQVVH
jgi:hypothetical protein